MSNCTNVVPPVPTSWHRCQNYSQVPHILVILVPKFWHRCQNYSQMSQILVILIPKLWHRYQVVAPVSSYGAVLFILGKMLTWHRCHNFGTGDITTAPVRQVGGHIKLGKSLDCIITIWSYGEKYYYPNSKLQFVVPGPLFKTFTSGSRLSVLVRSTYIFAFFNCSRELNKFFINKKA